MKPDLQDRAITYRDLVCVLSSAADASRAGGRRDALSALDSLLTAVSDAAKVSNALPSLTDVAADGDGALLALFNEWRALKRDLDDSELDMDGALWKCGEDHLWKLEDEIANICPRTLHGKAVKLVVVDERGGWGETKQLGLVSDAWAILEPPAA